METESNYPNESFKPMNDPNEPVNSPQRSGCLTTFLILMMVANGIVVLMYLLMGDKIARTAKIPSFAPYLMVIFGIFNIIFAYMIYNWKKAGVYGIVTNAAITLVINLALGLGATSFGGIVGIIILLALVSPAWKYFE